MINYQMINHCKEIEDLLPYRLLIVSKILALKSVKIKLSDRECKDTVH